ncbi:CLUMA_CG021539, isoform A [Clunio marinus]|uniref:CLUMA_CG021539, isoform A n=1 Tax=Clunio marinus TaxID=568069 RepID=A0A1J1J8B1_9DIPT|nr:CLUMA_CG021539, isoform A [Clunio marinus]
MKREKKQKLQRLQLRYFVIFLSKKFNADVDSTNFEKVKVLSNFIYAKQSNSNERNWSIRNK